MMKTRTVNFFMATIAFILLTTSAFAQRATNQTKALYDVAVVMQKQFPTKREFQAFRPNDKVEAEQARVLMGAKVLLDKIAATKGRISPRQEAQFNRELAQLELDLANSTTGPNGKPSTCHGRCAKDFPGTGGGVGWQRFTCKLACIKICIGQICGSGGN